MNNEPQKTSQISVIRFSMIIIGLVLMVVYGSMAFTQASSIEAVRGKPFLWMKYAEKQDKDSIANPGLQPKSELSIAPVSSKSTVVHPNDSTAEPAPAPSETKDIRPKHTSATTAPAHQKSNKDAAYKSHDSQVSHAADVTIKVSQSVQSSDKIKSVKTDQQ